jgi:hypothetical protein
MSGATIINYGDTALPTTGAAVTLFNSVTAFPPGGSFHLLEQQWFQYGLFFDGATGSITGVVTGSYSHDKGTTWTTFYTSGTLVDDVNYADEVYVGLYKDIRFQLAVANENATVFRPSLALHCSKPTSKVTAAHVLHDDNAVATEVAVDAP